MIPVGHVKLPDVIYPIQGIQLGVTQAGVRYQNRDDLTVIAISQGHTALVSTTNAFCAAPVQVSREHLSQSDADDLCGNVNANVRYLLVNTGNANAGTGDDGILATMQTCQALANKTHVPVNAILPFSTGVIGEPLNANAIVKGLDSALDNLSLDNWAVAAKAICTTDTVAKVASEQVSLGEVVYHITGIAKGAGMIRPKMATMLGFIATDANVAPTLLKQMLKELVDVSFNRITVDGDMSTNDCCTLTATGLAWQEQIDSVDHPHYAKLYVGLKKVFVQLAKLIVRDGEGATKFISVTVSGGGSRQECCDVAYAVAHSPLVKTAFFASDPNWGRILAAVGYAGVADLDTAKITVHLDEVCICERGKRAADYLEAQGQAVMSRPEIVIHIDLGRGNATDTVYTCDLSYDYVKINADYRS